MVVFEVRAAFWRNHGDDIQAKNVKRQNDEAVIGVLQRPKPLVKHFAKERGPMFELKNDYDMISNISRNGFYPESSGFYPATVLHHLCRNALLKALCSVWSAASWKSCQDDQDDNFSIHLKGLKWSCFNFIIPIGFSAQSAHIWSKVSVLTK